MCCSGLHPHSASCSIDITHTGWRACWPLNHILSQLSCELKHLTLWCRKKVTLDTSVTPSILLNLTWSYINLIIKNINVHVQTQTKHLNKNNVLVIHACKGDSHLREEAAEEMCEIPKKICISTFTAFLLRSNSLWNQYSVCLLMCSGHSNLQRPKLCAKVTDCLQLRHCDPTDQLSTLKWRSVATDRLRLLLSVSDSFHLDGRWGPVHVLQWMWRAVALVCLTCCVWCIMHI